MSIEQIRQGVDLMLQGARDYTELLEMGVIDQEDPELLACIRQADLLLKMCQWTLLDPGLTGVERLALGEAERKLIIINRLLTENTGKEQKTYGPH